MLRIDQIETPIGAVHLAVEGNALRAAAFAPLSLEGRAEPTPISGRLRAWFAGDLDALDGIEVAPVGTPFQKSVWALLQRIPRGETRTYGQLARELGSHPRAVGSANGANPIGIVIPCHRVVAADGTLCGYAWGQHRKRWLLDHESAARRDRA